MLSISCDSTHSHGAFAEQLGGVSFPMLSDFHPHGAVSQLYGVYNPERGNSFRSVFILDSGGVLRWKKVYPPGSLPEIPQLLAEVEKIT